MFSTVTALDNLTCLGGKRRRLDRYLQLPWQLPGQYSIRCRRMCLPGGLFSLSSAAEKVLRLVNPGHIPFQNSSVPVTSSTSSPSLSRRVHVPGFPGHMRMAFPHVSRPRYAVRGIVYDPWRGDWVLAPSLCVSL